MTVIPYAADTRPDTGFSNGQLGMWLFLFSEVMLFGALLSAYVLLRTGGPGWPRGADRLGLGLASFNTAILVLSSVSMARASGAALRGNRQRARLLAAVTAVLGAAFLLVTSVEWFGQLRAGHVPSADTFMAIWYVLTGVHALHVLGGVALLAWLAPACADESGGGRAMARLPLAGMYWMFVDVVWVAIFAAVYVF